MKTAPQILERPVKSTPKVDTPKKPESVRTSDKSSNISAQYGISELETLIANYLRDHNREVIDEKNTDYPPATTKERLAFLEVAFGSRNGRSVADYVREFFPQVVAAEALEVAPQPALAQLPEAAPALWGRDKQRGDTPPNFIRRHYQPWLGNGQTPSALTRPVLKRLDPRLYVGLSNWLRHNEMPADLNLPTLKEANDAWVSAIDAGRSFEGLDLTQVERLAAVKRMRALRSKD